MSWSVEAPLFSDAYLLVINMNKIGNDFTDLVVNTTERNRHTFVIDFLLSGKSPGNLLAERRLQEALWVMSYIRKGPNPEMAMTDPSLFTRLRNAITNLMVQGWL